VPIEPDDLDFRAVASQAPVAWSVVDLEGRQVVGNQVYADLFGYEIDEMRDLTVHDLTHPEDRTWTDDYLARLISGETDRFETDKHYVRKDGSSFRGHLVASLMRDEAGAPMALVGVIADVTAERAMAEQLILAEERLSKMLTNISDTLTLVSADGEISATSGLHTEVLGYPTDFWPGRQILDIVHPDDVEQARAMADGVLQAPGTELTAEFRIRHRQGHYEDVEMAAVNLLDDPAVGAIVLTTRNVTERKANQRAMAQMRDRALALAEQRAAFVANVSHELRTPLHAVLGLTELLGDSELTTEQAEFVEGIRFEARRLHETVDDLLDYARIEADGITLEPSAVDLAELVDSVLRRAAVSEFARGLTIDAAVGDEVPDVLRVDGHRLDQILTNLVGNAVKFTPEGRVDLVIAVTADQQLVFEVADTGPGVPSEMRSAVFEPFAQVPGTVSAVGGTGLGLALVRGLVALMSGSVELDCPPTGGSVFRVRLPLEAGERRAVSEERVGPDVPPRGASVLVVEDNEVNQLLVRQQLERLGHRSRIVGTAGAGLDLLCGAHHEFDLVLMDWQLPEIDGLEATRRLRSHERAHGGHVPVIAVTASAMPEDRAACRAAGMDDFLPKPVAMAELAAVIDRWTQAPVDATVSPTTTTVTEAVGGIDPAALERLVDDLGDRTVVVSLVERYLAELMEREERLVEALRADDHEVLHRVGHTLRSTSEMLGATGLTDVCRRLERANDDADLGQLMAEFASAAGAARTGLRRWIDDTTGEEGS
jgi:PAS domain S-box-containing protein